MGRGGYLSKSGGVGASAVGEGVGDSRTSPTKQVPGVVLLVQNGSL